MDFPKKQAQRLMPLYLLEYNEKLFEYHPDPSASWGGGSGGSYTGGDGITISSQNVISVDNTIAKKSDIPTNYVTTDTYQVITGQKQINTAFYFGDGNHNSIMIDGDYVNRPLIAMYNDTLGSEFSIGVDDNTETTVNGAYFSYEDNNGLRFYALPHQSDTGANTYTLATTSDLPTKTSDLTNDSGFITSSALTSYVTTTQLEDALDDYALSTDIPTEVSQLTNDAGYTTQTWVQNQGYITGITSSMVTTALGYTPGTSNFSGSYNDLTDKPTLSTVATTGSYNDLTDKPTIPDTSNFVTTDTIQTISVTKYFSSGTLVIKDSVQTLSHYTDMFKYSDLAGDIDFELPINKTKGTVSEPTKYTLATIDDIPSLTGYATEQWVTNQGYSTFSGSYNDLTNKPTYSTVATTGSYNDLTNKPDLSIYAESADLSTVATTGSYNDLSDKPTIPTSATSTSTVTPTTETLVFTLSDDSTVTVNVMTGATVSTTTTLS